MSPYPMRLGRAEFKAISAKVKARAARRVERVADNNALASKSTGSGPRTGVRAKKVPRATLRKRLVKALDTEFSLLIRSLWPNCPFCGGKTEHCFHFVTRAKYSVRWDERNAVGSCAGCNLRYEFDPHFAIQWYIAFNGLRSYEQLIRDGNQIAKHPNEALERVLWQIRERRKHL